MEDRDELPPGAVLGQYEIMHLLATGGMAEIYLARVRSTAGFEKRVALKRILPHYAQDRAFVTMFLDEARLAATLRHANIASVFDVGAENQSYFFAMEYVHGQDARAIRPKAWKQRYSLPLEIAISIAGGMASALGYAHAKHDKRGVPLNLVHRDVTPSNILISYDGAIKLVDFGIARASTRNAQKTQTGTLRGKVPYLSPEQVRGHVLDGRSDLFSLGTVLYELTTGVRPFRGETDFEIMERIVRTRAIPPSRVVDGYPLRLETIIMNLLVTERDDRYQDAETLLADLEQLIDEEDLFLSDLVVAKFMRETFAAQIAAELEPAPEDDADAEWGVSPQAFSDATRMYPDGVPSALIEKLVPREPPPLPEPEPELESTVPEHTPSPAAADPAPKPKRPGPPPPPPKRTAPARAPRAPLVDVPLPARVPSEPLIEVSTRAPSEPIMEVTTRFASEPLIEVSTRAPSEPIMEVTTRFASEPQIEVGTRAPSEQLMEVTTRFPSEPPIEARFPSEPSIEVRFPSEPPIEPRFPSAPPARAPSAPPARAPSAPPVVPARAPSAPPVAQVPSAPVLRPATSPGERPKRKFWTAPIVRFKQPDDDLAIAVEGGGGVVEEIVSKESSGVIMLPFDPIDARSAEILDAVEASVPVAERIGAYLQRAFVWFDQGDLDRAVAAIDLAMTESTSALLAPHLEAIGRVYAAFLGDPSGNLVLTQPLEELGNVPLSPRAAFLLSRLDGASTIEELLDVSGMPRIEAQRTLCQLFQRGVLRRA